MSTRRSPKAAAAAAVPEGFDTAGFERIAKMIFIRMQAANDAGDLNDLRNFTTPEMFASIKLDLQDRGSNPNQTDVVKIDAEVLEVAEEASSRIVSVRFHGRIVEETGAAPVAWPIRSERHRRLQLSSQARSSSSRFWRSHRPRRAAGSVAHCAGRCHAAAQRLTPRRRL
mgnify:CR=1 FL=1